MAHIYENRITGERISYSSQEKEYFEKFGNITAFKYLGEYNEQGELVQAYKEAERVEIHLCKEVNELLEEKEITTKTKKDVKKKK